MNKKTLIDFLGWGFVLWLIGYILGIVLFAVVPVNLIGWVISPIGIAVLLFVLLKKIKNESLIYYLILASVWTIIAVVFDYIFIVLLFHPKDGYYKFDVFLYYFLTFGITLAVGIIKSNKK